MPVFAPFRFFLFSFLWLSPALLWGQNFQFDDSQRGFEAMRIMFYNVENLFDTQNDSLINDEAFLPEGDNHWSIHKYYTKQQMLSKCISAVGGWENPEIIGLCEIENKKVLVELVNQNSLKSAKYGIVHHNSPDGRGIDVALLYRREKFKVISDTAIKVVFPNDSKSRTRDILYVKGLALETDTLHLFVTHWPSKYGGAFVTVPKRAHVATILKHLSDSIRIANPKANIIIMGDFNDKPEDESVSNFLQAKSPENYTSNDLVNLMFPMSKKGLGSHFYDGSGFNEWSTIDQLVVSANLLSPENRLMVKNNQAYIFKAPFLLKTNKNGLEVPFRTFIGQRYSGGFSDHLPVYLDLQVK